MNPHFSVELSYLKYYFQTKLPVCFAKYYLEFGDMLESMSIGEFCQQFIDHTGLSATQSRLRYLLNRIQVIIAAEKKATDEFDLDTLMIIKDGKYKA